MRSGIDVGVSRFFVDEHGGCVCGRGAAESDRWEKIARDALYLDREDFLPSGYKVSAKFKAPASTPSRP